MRIILAVSAMAAALLSQTPGPQAGKTMSGYTLMDYEAGYMDSSFDGKIDTMSDGVKITLRSEDPAKKPLPITARQVKFFWAENGAKEPARIVLEGKVVVEHPEANVQAEKAEWDFEKGILTFTGSPVMRSPNMPDGITAQKVVLNFNDGRVQVYGGRAHNARLGGMGEDKEPPKKPEEQKP
jgi:hypothetical protein